MRSIKKMSQELMVFTSLLQPAKKHLQLLLLLFSPFMLLAQKNFQPGVIVNLNGDTAFGYIDYKEWNLSPTSILFKASDNSESKELTIDDLRYFEISGKEAYYRFSVKISLDRTDISSVGLIDTSSKMDVVFLKLVQKGQVGSLFSYSDKIKERFYILQKNELQPRELVLRKYYASDDIRLQQLITDERYKNQLKQMFYSANLLSDKLSKNIDGISYKEEDLKKIFLQTDKSDVISQEAVQRPSKLRWFAGLGFQRAKTSVEGDHILAKYEIENKPSYFPQISGGFDLYANPHIGKLLLRLETGLQMTKSTTTASWNTDKKVIYDLAYSSASLSAQMVYNVYNKEHLKIPLGIGFVYSVASYSKNDYKEIYSSGQEGKRQENYFKLNTNYPGYLAKIGIILNNKLEISFQYQRNASLTKYLLFSIENRSMQLQVNYLFKRRVVGKS